MANVNQWRNTVIGKPVDIDGYYGNQCVDIAMSWAQYAFPGHGWPELLGYGDAKDLYKNANPAYFDKIGVTTAQPGDMPVYAGRTGNPEGHIAVVTSADANHMNVVENNGYNPAGLAYDASRPYTNLIGLLRPKGQVEDMSAAQDAETRQNFLRSIAKELGVDYKDGNDLPQMIANARRLYQLVDEKDSEIRSLRQQVGDAKPLAPGKYLVND